MEREREERGKSKHTTISNSKDHIQPPRSNRNSNTSVITQVVVGNQTTNFRTVNAQGTRTTKTIFYGDNTISYLQTATRDNNIERTSQDNQWTLVTNGKKETPFNNYIFVGNLPTNATNMDIWVAVQGNKFAVELCTLPNRDKNNNKYAFPLLKKQHKAEDVLKALHKTKLFGRILGLAKARKGPSLHTVGYKPSHTKSQQETPLNNRSVHDLSSSAFPLLPKKHTKLQEPHFKGTNISDDSILNIQPVTDFKESIKHSMICITHTVDSADTRKKILALSINFVHIKAITGYKFLLIFDDKNSFDNFKTDMVSSIFSDVRYVDTKDLTTSRIARLYILGLPIYTWNSATLNLLVSKWGTLISCLPLNHRDNNFISPTVLIETVLPAHIVGTVKIQIEGHIFLVSISEVSTHCISHNTMHVATTTI